MKMDNKKTTAIYVGGFKPPTFGHFEVVKRALEQNPKIDKFLIFVGNAPRDGINQDQSLKVWDIYKKYLPFKVEILKSNKTPVKDLFDYAKENPDEIILWILGAREGNEEDFKDIASRTKTVSKYDNITVQNIITSGGVSGTAARNALQVSKDKFDNFLPKELSEEEKQEIYILLKNQITEYLDNKVSYLDHIDYKQYIKDLIYYFIEKYPQLTSLPKIKLIHGDVKNAKDFFGKTAYYDPNTKTIVLYTEGRHPKDLIRSLSHEMIHFIQDQRGDLDNITTQNTTEDDYLNKIEKEAYLKGNINFRNWTDSIKKEKFTQETKTKMKDPFGLNAYAVELGRLREDENTLKYQIFCDLDSVLVDFDKGYEQLTGLSTKNNFIQDKDQFWEEFRNNLSKKNMTEYEYWSKLDWTNDGKILWNYIKKYNPYILTAPSRDPQSKEGKKAWTTRLDNMKNIYFRSSDTKHHFSGSNRILIDDRDSIIKDWISNGGIGILHTSAKNTIEQLKKIGL
jgi:phosphopantetheine adenylyltransferase